MSRHANRKLSLPSEPPPRNQAQIEQQFSRLDEFRRLEPEWDSYDAPAPSERAVVYAGKILRFILDRDLALTPSVSPTADGGILLVFSSAPRYADIECFNNGEILALTSEGEGAPNIWPIDTETDSLAIALEQISAFIYE
jgi:hypothetical protein